MFSRFIQEKINQNSIIILKKNRSLKKIIFDYICVVDCIEDVVVSSEIYKDSYNLSFSTNKSA